MKHKNVTFFTRKIISSSLLLPSWSCVVVYLPGPRIYSAVHQQITIFYFIYYHFYLLFLLFFVLWCPPFAFAFLAVFPAQDIPLFAPHSANYFPPFSFLSLRVPQNLLNLFNIIAIIMTKEMIIM